MSAPDEGCRRVMAFTGKPIFLLEDELLIAMDIEETLAAAGYCDVVTLTTNVGAEAWLASHIPSLAILDIRLKDGESAIIASDLAAQGIPFIVHSGTPQGSGGFDEVFLQGHWISKPFLAEELVRAVQKMLVDNPK